MTQTWCLRAWTTLQRRQSKTFSCISDISCINIWSKKFEKFIVKTLLWGRLWHITYFCASIPHYMHFCNFQYNSDGQRDTNTRRELSVRLPPCLPLPLLPCDVFWPDSMAPGRQWHDHRNRGQKGHSSLLVNLEMSFAILAGSLWNSFLKHFIFSKENNNVVIQLGDQSDASMLSVTLLIQTLYDGNPPLMPSSLNMSMYCSFWLYSCIQANLPPQWQINPSILLLPNPQLCICFGWTVS